MERALARDQSEGARLIEVLLKSGKEHSQRKEYGLAIGKFKEIIKLDPDNDEGHFELGKIYLIQEKYNLAKEQLLRTVDLNSSNPFAHLLLAKAYKYNGQKKDAIEEFKKVMNLAYKEENIAKEISDIYKELGEEYELSIDFLKKSLEYGYDSEEFKKDLNELYWKEIRLLQDYNFKGEYSKAIEGANRFSNIIPKENLMLQNILLSEKEIAQKKIILCSKVRSLTFTLTNRCNLKCLMCNTRKKSWSLPDKTKQEIIKLLPYLERIMWQGGEAFLYDDFEELLDETAKFPIRQVLATNGLLINERMAEKLVGYNVELTFSIDGATKAVYEYIRPGANFEKVLQKVNLINTLRRKNNSKMSTRLNVLIMRANYHQIEDFVELAKEYKFNTLFFNSVGCDFKNFQENIFYYYHDPEILAYINKIRDRITKKAKELGVKLENWLPSTEFLQQALKENLQKDDESVNKKYSKDRKESEAAGSPEKIFCHAPWQRLYIDCGGGVRPDCLCLPEKPVGNLLENTLEEIWNNEKIKELRKKIVNNDYQNFCNPDCVWGRVPERNLKFV